MFKILDRNRAPMGVIEWSQDCTITRKLDMDDRLLEFSITKEEYALSGIELEGYIQTQNGEEFVIREIKRSYDGPVTVIAPYNVEELEGHICHDLKTDQISPDAAFVLARERSGLDNWGSSSFGGISTKNRVINMENASMYEIIKQMNSTYRCECTIDSSQKVVRFYAERGSDRGVYFHDELNLKSIEIDSNSNEFYTEIEPYGKDDIDIAIANQGSKYLSNYTYSNKHKRCIWKDGRYTDPAILMIDAQDKLLDLCKPHTSYTVSIIDLAKMSDSYSFLDFGVGDTVTIISRRTKLKDKRRIIEIVEHPFDPTQNTCLIGDPKPNYQELIESIRYSTGAVTSPYDLTSGHNPELLSSSSDD